MKRISWQPKITLDSHFKDFQVNRSIKELQYFHPEE